MIVQLTKYAEEVSAKADRESRLAQVMLTMGADGVLIYEGEKFHHFEGKKFDEGKIKSVVGAGDSFLGGFTAGLLSKQSLADCVENGQLCAEKTLASEKNVSPEITPALIQLK